LLCVIVWIGDEYLIGKENVESNMNDDRNIGIVLVLDLFVWQRNLK
jgi:hypothetical protein